ncbi:MAG: hypothetical protein Q8936_00685 [Bacillota bacterium]|nr:hypothetical protein [Bacillota bacterium]
MSKKSIKTICLLLASVFLGIVTSGTYAYLTGSGNANYSVIARYVIPSKILFALNGSRWNVPETRLTNEAFIVDRNQKLISMNIYPGATHEKNIVVQNNKTSAAQEFYTEPVNTQSNLVVSFTPFVQTPFIMMLYTGSTDTSYFYSDTKSGINSRVYMNKNTVAASSNSTFHLRVQFPENANDINSLLSSWMPNTTNGSDSNTSDLRTYWSNKLSSSSYDANNYADKTYHYKNGIIVGLK